MVEFDSKDFMSDFQALIECESFSQDPESLARSAQLVSRIGTAVGAAPHLIGNRLAPPCVVALRHRAPQGSYSSVITTLCGQRAPCLL